MNRPPEARAEEKDGSGRRSRSDQERSSRREGRTAKQKGTDKEQEKEKGRSETGTGDQAGPVARRRRNLPPRAKVTEPAPQKPNIRLPTDAIRAGKAGAKPLSEHIRKHEQKRIAAEAASQDFAPQGSAAGRRFRRAGQGRRLPAASVRAAPAVSGARRRRRKRAGATLGGREQRQ